ncbi:MAG: type IX secretion system membrane protein PorP/SprF, partial [Crocinitomicaceae bacterium]|nr:type IX secretion system membrane protein PorP/SprF [Crocinitomicaceae bacterium]
LITVLLSVLIALSSTGQDAHFTQFYANPVYLNPALAGLRGCPTVTMNYRNQWPGIKDAYTTYSTSFDKYSEKLKGGVGVNVFHDRSGGGRLTTTAASAVYAYQYQISKKVTIKLGGKATYVNKSIDWNRLVFGDMIDAREGIVYGTQQQFGEPVHYADFSAGALLYTDYFFGGFAVDHLTKPAEGLLNRYATSLPRKYTFHAGANIPLGKMRKMNRAISPNIMITKQNEFTQVNVGMYLRLRELVVGTWYRNKDSFILLAGIETSKFKFAYSYDVTTSGILQQSMGSHELSYSIFIPCSNKKKKFRTLHCPVF